MTIDYEDREQVERLEWLYLRDTHDNCDDTTECMQAALREFANPPDPKPEEPTGLYARVEDATGCVWVRTALQASVWRRESVNSAGLRYLIPQDGCKDYPDIAAVRVLSEGVK